MDNTSNINGNLWDNIKNKVAEINGITKESSFKKNRIYTNEDIMVMFIFKLNDRYRYSSLVDFGLLNDLDKLFIENYDTKENYLNYAIPKVENYINDIQKKIEEIKSTKDVKSKPLIFNIEKFIENNEDLKIDSALLAAAVPQLTNLAKYRYLAKLLYEKDKKYLDLAKESIILFNNNISLDMMVFGSDNLTRKKQIKSVEHFNNNSNCSKSINILIICIILIIILYVKNYAGRVL
jgi:hypothetical protein